MYRVWKYPVSYKVTEIDMPMGAKVLSFDVQKGTPTLWALVDPILPPMKRRFRLIGTGSEIPEREGQFKYIGTAQQEDGAVVWHLFEIAG